MNFARRDPVGARTDGCEPGFRDHQLLDCKLFMHLKFTVFDFLFDLSRTVFLPSVGVYQY